MARGDQFPFPEALRPALKAGDKRVTWSVRAGHVGATDIGKRRMQVPVGDDPTEEAARTHEMGHVRWSPAAPVLPEGLDLNCVLAVEDARINNKLDKAGLPVGSLISEAVNGAQWTMFMAQPVMPVSEMVLRGVSLAGSKMLLPYMEKLQTYVKDLRTKADTVSVERSDLLNIVRHFIQTAADAIVDETVGHADFQRTLMVAKWLQEQLEGFENDMRERIKAAKARAAAEASARAKASAAEVERLREGAAAARRATHKSTWTKLAEDAAPIAPKYAGNMAGGALPIWQPMKIKKPALVHPYPGHVYRRKMRSTDAGTVPRTMYRWAVDKSVFGEKRKKGEGGTVLVDASGSMGIQPGQLLKLLKLAPAAKVATYSGQDGGMENHGTLTIVAEKGKRARDADIVFTHGGNGVDHPALQWLSKQPGPRYWVSDAGVTCANGQYDKAREQCLATLKAMAGIRIPSVVDALKTFERMTKPGIVARRK